jgi:hypothetical protein
MGATESWLLLVVDVKEVKGYAGPGLAHFARFAVN